MSLKKQAISGVKWNFAQQFSIQVINFAVQVMLARLLMPEMFGLIAMIIVFISIGQTLMDGGMTSSLIRKNNPDQIDYSTVFVTNLVMSCIVYGLTYAIAPYVSIFYNQPDLTNILRLFALTFIINALVAVHIAKLTKEMNFKLQMKLQIPSVIVSGIVGVIMAYKGFGVWSLVYLNLVRALLFAIQVWFFVKWRPSLVFNKERFKYHFSFGYKLTLSSIINTVYDDAYRIIIGKSFSAASAGFFNQAETMRIFPVQQISTVVEKVTYPLFSKIETDLELKNTYRITMKLVLLISAPIMLSLILIAEEGFRFVFGEKWLPAVPLFQILALASIVRPVSSYNLNILKVKGRSDLFLKTEVIKKVIGIALILGALKFGIIGLVISLTVYSFISYIINMYYSGSLISYPIEEQLSDTLHFYIIGGVVFLFLFIVKSYLESYVIYDVANILLYSISFIVLFLVLLFAYDKDFIKVIKNYRKS